MRRPPMRVATVVKWGLWVAVAFMVCVYLWWLAAGAL